MTNEHSIDFDDRNHEITHPPQDRRPRAPSTTAFLGARTPTCGRLAPNRRAFHPLILCPVLLRCRHPPGMSLPPAVVWAKYTSDDGCDRPQAEGVFGRGCPWSSCSWHAVGIGLWCQVPETEEIPAQPGHVGRFGPIAQWLEQGTHNPLVTGSSPVGPTKPINQRVELIHSETNSTH